MPCLRALCIVVLCLLTPGAVAEASAAAPPVQWVAAFAAPAQAGPIPDTQPPASAANVRSIAHLSVGGSAIRIRLSNPASEGPDLRVAAVTVARQQQPGSPALVPGSTRAVRFRRARSVTIAAGTPYVYSDAIAMPVRTGDNLAITLHLPADVNPDARATTWSTGFRTANGAGDATREETGTSFTQAFEGGYALTAVDVRTDRAAGAIVGWGSSTFEGWGSTRDGYDRLLDRLAGRAQAEARDGERLSVVSAGVGGDTTAQGLSRLDRDVFSHSGVRAVILYNINDTGAQSRRTAEQVAADYRTIVSAARRRGVRVYCPLWGPGAQQLGQRERYRVNEWLKSDDHPCDGVADWASALAMTPHGGGYTPLYDVYQPQYVADGIHPNPAGHAALAAATPLRWLRAASTAGRAGR